MTDKSVEGRPADWWLTDDVATFLGVSSSTVRAYVARKQIPALDGMFGRSPGWKPRTIQTWHAARPRKSRSESPRV
jgi:predicted DNA-binding transcriptional regulator AlpA